MKVFVNGEARECPDGASLAQFVEHIQLHGDRVAVELNRQVATRTRWAEIGLHDGDQLEIVHFVGGGAV